MPRQGIYAINPQGVEEIVMATAKAFRLLFVPLGYKPVGVPEPLTLGVTDDEEARQGAINMIRANTLEQLHETPIGPLRMLADNVGVPHTGVKKSDLIDALRAYVDGLGTDEEGTDEEGTDEEGTDEEGTDDAQ